MKKYRAFEIILPNGETSMWYEDISSTNIKSTKKLIEKIRCEFPDNSIVKLAYTYK